MRFTDNSSYISRIIDTIANNRVTDFETEGASPNVYKNKLNLTLLSPLKQIHPKGGNKNMRSFSDKRNSGLSNQYKTTQYKTSYGGFNNKSQPNLKTPIPGRIDPLRTSKQPKAVNPVISGKDIRPDLHKKTYFKATTSMYIDKLSQKRLEKREGKQAYDTQHKGKPDKMLASLSCKLY